MDRSSLLALLLLLPLSSAGARAVPDIALKDAHGHPQKLSTLRGKVIVLNFWATWCAPCRDELPRISRLGEAYMGKPVEFVAVSIDAAKDQGKIAPLFEQQGIHLKIWMGADTDTMARFGLGDIVPSTIILDQRGEAVTRIAGEARDMDVSKSVDWLLNGRVGPAPAARLKRY